MTNLQKQIDLLEVKQNEAELLSQLACNPETRAINRQLAETLREAATRVRGEVAAIATLRLPGQREKPLAYPFP